VTETDARSNKQNDGLHHASVLLKESIEYLNVRQGLTYIDATAGAGGHLRAIAEAQGAAVATAATKAAPEFAASTSAAGTTPGVIGIDRDSKTLERLRKELSNDRVGLYHANFTEIAEVAHEAGLSTVTGGILADLGVSSMQIDDPERGFSFLKDGPLDMRMDNTQSLTAWDIANHWKEQEIADIIYQYGEERYSRAIARNIVNSRPVQTTLQLSDIVSRSVRYKNAARKGHGKRNSAGGNFDHSHPATRTFQALRIAVNDELSSLRKFLDQSVSLLAPGARLVVITFHSLEDRMVKQFLRQKAASCHCPPKQPQCTCNGKSELLIITKKPIVADSTEVVANIRSRSAKLRAGEKIG
jgi:16S rRNA (cytosine1402-N4)-methyltransferase